MEIKMKDTAAVRNQFAGHMASRFLRVFIGTILFCMLLFSGLAAATSFTGDAVMTYNGQRVLQKGKKVNIIWQYSPIKSSYKCSFKVTLGGSTLFSSTSKSGSRTVELNSVGTLTATMVITYTNANPQRYTDSISVIRYPYSGSLTWSCSGGTLTFTGNGAMGNYESFSRTPWYELSRDITRIVINEGATSIGKNAFEFYSKLTTVVLPSTLNSIGEYAFMDCSMLEEITIPQNVRSLGDSAFAHCDTLKRVSLPPALKTIGVGTFSSCPALTELLIPEGTDSIGNNAFLETPVTLTVYRGSKAQNYAQDKNIPYVLYSCPVHTEGIFLGLSPTESTPGWYNVSCSVCHEMIVERKEIPALNDMNVVRLPLSVKTVGEDSFSGLTECQAVIIPKGCTSIGKNAFMNCKNLLYIRIPAETDLDEEAFTGCDKYLVIDRTAE